ncbi:CBS domain-containing protein [Limnohabitans sp. JirII-31]|uniref:CBS domain-containing protein n=1 Tax=Limnohabitans sp. JirII-31 TaxID=1977908 RepID=UPI003513665D
MLSQGALVGIFSERDYARKVTLFGKSSDTTQVRDVMTADVITIDASQKIDKCMQIMTDRHIRHLPVLKDGQLIGVISIGDVVREMMAHQKYLIDQLESYIRG